jgi:hypothetical protein
MATEDFTLAAVKKKLESIQVSKQRKIKMSPRSQRQYKRRFLAPFPCSKYGTYLH